MIQDLIFAIFCPPFFSSYSVIILERLDIVKQFLSSIYDNFNVYHIFISILYHLHEYINLLMG